MNPTKEKYNTRAKKINSLLCVGLDPDFEKLPERFKKMENPQFEFNKWIIEETHNYTAAYKPNIAFYEAQGDKGLRELKMTMDYLVKNYPEIFTVCDAKRADIGNTNQGYVKEVFDWLGSDSITLHPYMGKESLQPFLDRTDKVSIILCRTSNPGARELQDLQISGKPLWQVVTEKVRDEWNEKGNCILMVGATYPEELKKIRSLVGDMDILIAGIAAQGGEAKATVEAGVNSKGLGLIINSSRGIIFSDNPKEEARKLCEEIRKYSSLA